MQFIEAPEMRDKTPDEVYEREQRQQHQRDLQRVGEIEFLERQRCQITTDPNRCGDQRHLAAFRIAPRHAVRVLVSGRCFLIHRTPPPRTSNCSAVFRELLIRYRTRSPSGTVWTSTSAIWSAHPGWKYLSNSDSPKQPATPIAVAITGNFGAGLSHDRNGLQFCVMCRYKASFTFCQVCFTQTHILLVPNRRGESEGRARLVPLTEKGAGMRGGLAQPRFRPLLLRPNQQPRVPVLRSPAFPFAKLRP